MEPLTFNSLTQAMRGMSRDAPLLIRLPNGTLVEIDHITSAYPVNRQEHIEGIPVGGHCAIVFAAKS